MGVTEQLAYETRVRPRQAVIAGAAAALLLLAPVMELAGLHTDVSELTLGLITIHKRFPLDLIAAVINGIAYLLLAGTLGWLADRTRVRSPTARNWSRWVAVGGAVALAIGVAGSEVLISIAANKFVSTGAQTYLQAYALASTGAIRVLALTEELGALAADAGLRLHRPECDAGRFAPSLSRLYRGRGRRAGPGPDCPGADRAVLLAGGAGGAAGGPLAVRDAAGLDQRRGDSLGTRDPEERIPRSGPGPAVAVRSPACGSVHGGRRIRSRREHRPEHRLQRRADPREHPQA